MTTLAWLQLAAFFAILLVMGLPLGHYMARVYEGEAKVAQRILGPVERLIYRLLGIDPNREMAWREYAMAILAISVLSILIVYLIQRLQGVLPFNPAGFGAVAPALALNTAISFATNTNWQAYGGEMSLSYFTQAAALGVQNFVSAAAGMAVLAAFIRGLHRRSSATIGNAWVDITRSVLYILLPMSLVLSLALVSQGVVQTWKPYKEATLVQPLQLDSSTVTTQTIPLGPAASQIAIKQLGTNGGGFFNINSAHPFENPTPFSNLLEVVSILLISLRTLLHLRPHGQGRTPGLGGAGGDDGDLHPAHRSTPSPPNNGGIPPSPRSASTRRPPPCSPAATWRARRCGSAR